MRSYFQYQLVMMSSIFDFQGSKKDDFEFPENKKRNC